MKDGSEAIGVGERKKIRTPGVVSLHSNNLLVSFHDFPFGWLSVTDVHQVPLEEAKL